MSAARGQGSTALLGIHSLHGLVQYVSAKLGDVFLFFKAAGVERGDLGDGALRDDSSGKVPTPRPPVVFRWA